MANDETLYRGGNGRDFHISAGGVVYKSLENGEIQVLILHRIPHGDWRDDSWHFPKGTRKDFEAIKQTAQREIEEETGYRVRLERYLGYLESFYPRDGILVHKLTHYYAALALEPFSEITKEHHERKWVSLDEAFRLLAPLPEIEAERDTLSLLREYLDEAA